ncbi:MAG: hypothetical protein O4859_10100 [Trichodesmium sp. St18_bin1]|nr:hypothetical protein [Trichodesmium sp. St18_bin1]
MGVFESETQLIFDEIISANYSEHQEDWIAVYGKSLKNTLTNYEQNGQNILLTISGFSLETKLIRVSKTFESKKSSEIKQVQELIRDRGLENKTFTLDALGPQ